MTPRVRATAPVGGSLLPHPIRHLVLVLGDQLDATSSAFDGFDAERDVVWMAEVMEESTHVWSSKPRTAVFLSAMRHFAAAQIHADGGAQTQRTAVRDDGLNARMLCSGQQRGSAAH